MKKIRLIYIYTPDKNITEHDTWTKLHRKIRGVYCDKQKLVQRLMIDIFRVFSSFYTNMCFCDQNEKSTQDLLEENALFQKHQLYMETIFQMTNVDDAKGDIVEVSIPFYLDNKKQQEIIKEFGTTYRHEHVIQWYTRKCFLYRILNRALRTQEMCIILKFRLIIRDLHHTLLPLHSHSLITSNPTLYRGQRISSEELQKLKSKVDSLICMNTFLSATTNKEVASIFAGGESTKDTNSVLFEITIADTSPTPFANIKEFSQFQDEEEYLFSIRTVFRISRVEFKDEIWVIKLILVGADDGKRKTIINEYHLERPWKLSEK
ncbi:unnamed protein product [Didymodactylos carnosus]|uniref:NAD(P)(+)--arginine ADP-ribosyltransferase n=1 Tax=Didymodactylos carnosus TaxID=1234261 RepID=A0A8S2HD30_9BILA|nr:unnamed protein product [Didymodactylos carnosus]CAF3630320.1 unnamed protein product [Didymodactylos carnosus]